MENNLVEYEFSFNVRVQLLLNFNRTGDHLQFRPKNGKHCNRTILDVTCSEGRAGEIIKLVVKLSQLVRTEVKSISLKTTALMYSI